MVGFVLFNFGNQTADDSIPQEKYYFCPLESSQIDFGNVSLANYFGAKNLGQIDKYLGAENIDFRGLSQLFAGIGNDPEKRHRFLEYLNLMPLSDRVSAVTVHHPNVYDFATRTVKHFAPRDTSIDVGAIFCGTDTDSLCIAFPAIDKISLFLECEPIIGYSRKV